MSWHKNSKICIFTIGISLKPPYAKLYYTIRFLKYFYVVHSFFVLYYKWCGLYEMVTGVQKETSGLILFLQSSCAQTPWLLVVRPTSLLFVRQRKWQITVSEQEYAAAADPCWPAALHSTKHGMHKQTVTVADLIWCSNVICCIRLLKWRASQYLTFQSDVLFSVDLVAALPSGLFNLNY